MAIRFKIVCFVAALLAATAVPTLGKPLDKSSFLQRVERSRQIARGRMLAGSWCKDKTAQGIFNIGNNCNISYGECFVGQVKHDSAVCMTKGQLELIGLPFEDGSLPAIYRSDNTKYRIFTLTGNSILKIKSLIIRGGDVTPDMYGGGAFVYGPSAMLELRDSQITNNFAESAGAVRVEYGVLDIENSQINDNAALLWGGGIICTKGALCNITGAATTLIANSALYTGGALKCSGGAECFVEEAATLERNKGNYYGGGIFCEGTGTKCHVGSNSIVQINVAKVNPGIFCDNGAECTTDDTAWSRYCFAGTYGLKETFSTDPTAADSELSPCTECPEGKFGDKASAGYNNPTKGCNYTSETCPAGSFCPGTKGPTIPCPLGTFGNLKGKGDQSAACYEQCPAGKFGHLVGQTSESSACLNCTGGTYGNTTGQKSRCSGACVSGTFGNVAGATSATEACNQQCPKGRFGTGEGGNSLESACQLCVSGKFANTIQQASTCSGKCPPGKHGKKLGGITEAGSCSDCPVGKFEGKSGQGDACSQQCMPGKFGAVLGQTLAVAACTESCPAGRYGSESGKSSLAAACPQSCEAGRYGSVPGQTTKALACPSTCPKGKFGIKAGAVSEEMGCMVCPAGKFSDVGGALVCKDCPAGTGLADNGAVLGSHDEASDCRTCDGGRYSLAGAKECSMCAGGRFLEDPGTAKELHDADSRCLVCPAGRWNNLEEARLCIQCNPSRRCEGGDTCLLGRAGYACIDCSKEKGEQYYTTDEGKTCIKCPDNNVGPIVLALLATACVCGGLYKTLGEANNSNSTVDASQFFARNHTVASQVAVSLYQEEEMSALHCVIDISDAIFNEDGELINTNMDDYDVVFTGRIGIKVGENMIVEDVVPGSAAEKEGVEKGDRIEAIDDDDVPLDSKPNAVIHLLAEKIKTNKKVMVTFVRTTSDDDYLKESEARSGEATGGQGLQHRRWFLIDLDSTNGTRLNGKDIKKDSAVALDIGMAIGMGTSVMKIISWDRLLVVSGPHKGKEYRIPQKGKTLISFGRASEAKQCGAILSSCQAHREAQKTFDDNTVYAQLKAMKKKLEKKKKKQADADVKKVNVRAGAATQASVVSRQIARTFNVLSAHTITLSIAMPDFTLVHLPPWLKKVITDMLEILSVDLSGMTSSPECAWELDAQDTYLMKMSFPALLLVVFAVWSVASYLYYSWVIESSDFNIGGLKRQRRSSQNRIVAVGFYLWAVFVYALTLQQVLSGINCVEGEGGAPRLVMDSSVICDLSLGGQWSLIFAFSVLLFIVYCVVPVFVAARKVFAWNGRCCSTGSDTTLPKWVDKRNCKKLQFDGSPCQQCPNCDKRQRYGWMFEKYRPESYFWESVVLFRKLAIAMVQLFFITKKILSHSLMIGINMIVFIYTVIRQPYLADREKITTVQLRKKKSCSWKSCGSNNVLDASLLFSEILLAIAALGNDAVLKELALSFAVDTNPKAGNSTNATAISAVDQPSDQELFDEHYPAAGVVLATLEYIGVIIILFAVLLLVKEMLRAAVVTYSSRVLKRKLRKARAARVTDSLSKNIKKPVYTGPVPTDETSAIMQNMEDANELRKTLQANRNKKSKSRLAERRAARRAKKEKNGAKKKKRRKSKKQDKEEKPADDTPAKLAEENSAEDTHAKPAEAKEESKPAE